MSVFPVNRVPDILKRMDLNSSQAEAMKTCFGVLAIMSRENVNKALIAKDGMEIILNAMTVHIDRTDVQESGCDLLWSLAFNSSAVKEIIAKYGGAVVLVRALKRHSRSAEFLKSACGALSNMCQSKLNQESVSSQGGLQPLVGSIHVHQTNAKLLPFIFDAIASIIVNNEENAKNVSSLGIVPVVVASLSRHKSCMEVVKSGCHTLAILSDVKGQASKIAFAGGVPIILSLLDAHPLYSDLHRVAAVVLLRMLQESAHVGREITCHDGVRILLNSLEKGGAQHDTVAAVTHILYTVTNPSSPAAASIESQLWLPASLAFVSEGDAKRKAGANALHSSVEGTIPVGPTTALGGVVTILGQYSGRRDVVRAACRLINNLSGYANVVSSLDRLGVLDRIFECAGIHKDTKDVMDSASSLVKAVHRKGTPQLQTPTVANMQGLLHVLRAKAHDEDAVVACLDTITRVIDAPANPAPRREEGVMWEHEVLSVTLGLLQSVVESEKESDIVAVTATTLSALSGKGPAGAVGGKVQWSKGTGRVVSSALAVIEAIYNSHKLSSDPLLFKDAMDMLLMLLRHMPYKSAELTKKIERLLPLIDCPKLPERPGAGKRTLSLKPPLIMGPTNGVSEDGTFMYNGVQMRRAGPLAGQEEAGLAAGKVRSPLAMNRKVSPLVGAEDRQGADDRNGWTIQQISQNGSANSLKSMDIEGGPFISDSTPGAVSTTSNSPKKILPKHPLKLKTPGALPPRMIDTWPSYLERLNPSPAINRAYLNPTSPDSCTPSRMQLTYESSSAAGKGLMSKCPTPVPYLVPANGLGEPFPHSLTFDSDFESGNLLRAVQKGDASYDLFLRSDLHTPGHTQWFYFAVANTHPPELVRLAEQGISVPPVRVRFNIVNFTKPDSLFNLGMRPVVYSVQDAQEKSAGWVRAGCDISYYGNSFQRSNAAGEGAAFYYTLSFTMEFQNPGDTMLIAYSYPYTVSDYRKYINETLDRPGASDVIRQSRLCYTLSGEDCDVLVITNFADREKERIGPISVQTTDNPESSKSRKGARPQLKPALFVSARVHPGETPASWMMKGMLDFLTSGTSQAQLLRQAFVIFVVPMLNPDGVMYGNNRCSLAGVDLNRQWKTPIKGVHPTVHSLKLFMLGQRKLREVNMYIDLHGHSRKYNVFMYGCDDKKRPRPQVRAFPKFFSMHNVGKKYVSFADCSFTVKKGRESTARVVVAKEINIPLSFTLEATFCGSSYGPLKHCHMNTGHLQEVGAALCDAILNFSISEGQVKDALLVPANLKAVAQVEKAIAEGLDEEDLLTVRDKVGTKMQRSSSGVLETISARKLSTTVLVKVGMEGKVTHTTAFGQGVGSEMDGALVLSGGMGSVGSGCSSPHSGRMVDNASEEVEDVAGEAVLSSDVDGEGEAEEAADEEVGSGSEDDDDDDVEAVEGEEEDDASDAESLMGPLGMDPKRGDSLIIKRSKTVGDPPSPGTGTMPTIPASAQRSSSGPDGSSLGREKAKAMRLLANAPRKGEEDDDSTDLMFGGTNMVSLSLNGGGIGIADSLFKTTKKVKKKKVGSDKTGSDKNSAVSQKIRSGASSSAGGGGRKNARIKDLSSTMPIKGKVYADDFEVVEKRGPGGTIVKAEFEDMFFRQEADDSNSSLAKAQAAATTFGLPKVNGAQRQY